MEFDIEFKIRFWDSVEVTSHEKCWIWQKSCAGNGYGVISYKSKQYAAHRIAYILVNDEDIPTNMQVCHVCDNPICVNPLHLFLGTADDNAKDKVNKERSLKGIKNPRSILSEEDILEIRQLFANGYTAKELSYIYKVGKSTVINIVVGNTWKHIGGPITKRGICKLSKEDVIEIRKLINNGMKQIDIAEKYDVIPNTISSINRKISWKNI